MEFIRDNIWAIIIFFNYAVAISAAIVIIQKNINPTKTLSYILVLVLFPFLGLLVYYFFGQEYRKTKIFNRKNVLNRKVVKEIQNELELKTSQLKKVDEHLDEKNKLVKLLHNNEKSKLTLYNDVKILINGEEKFKHLLKDIKKAKHHIHLEYYILRDDHIGTEVIDALCEKAKEGVKVKLSFDDVGSKVSKKIRQKMKSCGVEFYEFMPVLYSNLAGKTNYRNHRKIVVIDGEIGYVGGINIADNYINSDDKDGFWRDTHVRIQGEAVKSLQILFLTTWQFVSNNNFKITKELFPEIKCKTKTYVQIASSGPDSDWANIMETIFTAINGATDYVYITTPYFIPNDEIIAAIQVASRCNIDVRIILPKTSDSWTAKYATNSYIEKLLEANVKIYRYKKGFIHAKTMAVDDIFGSIGTANMDYRSFNINFEVNAIIYNETVCKALKRQFFKDIKDCDLVSHDSWLKRSRLDKIQESFCRLWAPLL